MNKYELLLVFKPVFEGDNLDTVVGTIETLIKNQKGKLLRTDKMGRKKLSYAIKKVREALVAVIGYEAPPEAAAVISHALKLNEEVIRYTNFRNEELDATKPFVVSPITGREPRELNTRGGGNRRPGGFGGGGNNIGGAGAAAGGRRAGGFGRPQQDAVEEVAV
jgi:small subunit ribosomal protein S6